MQIKCPKCGHEQTEDLSEFADEFSLSATMCEKCDAELAFDEDCHVSFLSAREPMAIAIDVVMRDRFNKILFVERKFPPELGKLALPGGFVGSFETCEQAAVREVFEECGLRIYESNLEQIGVFSIPNRDPRGRVISILYQYNAIITDEPRAGDDAKICKFINIHSNDFSVSNLAFDHADMLWCYYKMSPW